MTLGFKPFTLPHLYSIIKLVDMHTVCFVLFFFHLRYGDGDKTPKTLLGRLFGIVWVIVGAIMMSLFTALIINAMQGAFDGTKCQDIASKEVSYFEEFRLWSDLVSNVELFMCRTIN